jgi:hypothetical protein
VLIAVYKLIYKMNQNNESNHQPVIEIEDDDISILEDEDKVLPKKRRLFSYFCSNSMSQFLSKIKNALTVYAQDNQFTYYKVKLISESEWTRVYLSDMRAKNMTIAKNYAKKVRPNLRSINNLYAVFYILYTLGWKRKALVSFMMNNTAMNNKIREQDVNYEIDRLQFRLTWDHLEFMKRQWRHHVGFDEIMCYLKLCETEEIQVVSDLFFRAPGIQRDKSEAVVYLLRNISPRWQQLLIPVPICTSYPGYESLGYAKEWLVPREYHMLLTHVSRNNETVHIYESCGSYFDKHQPSDPHNKIFSDVAIQLTRTLTRQIGIKFSWEMKMGPGGDINDRKYKGVCGTYILCCANFVFDGETIPSRNPEGPHQPQFGVGKREALLKRVVQRFEQELKNQRPVRSTYVDTLVPDSDIDYDSDEDYFVVYVPKKKQKCNATEVENDN